MMQAGQHHRSSDFEAEPTECNDSHEEPLKKKQKFHEMEGTDSSVQAALQTGMLTVHHRGNEVDLKCTMCQCLLSGPAPAAEHLRGENHAKVCRWHSLCDNSAVAQDNINLDPGLPSEILLAKEAGYLRRVTKDGRSMFHCDLCQAPMTGIEPTLHHLRGDKHKKRCQSYNMGFNRLDKVASDALCPLGYDQSRATPSQEVDLGEEVDRGTVEKTTVRGAVHYRCTVCDVTMTGKEPTLSHFRGKSHKKMHNRKQLSTSMSGPPSNTSIASANSSFEGCTSAFGSATQPSADAFNSQLLASFARLGLSSTTDVVSEALSAGVLVEVCHEAFVCKVCSTGSVMSGRAPVQAHFDGRAHAKALARVRQKTPLPLMSSTPNEISSDDSGSILSFKSSSSGQDVPVFLGLDTATRTMISKAPNELSEDDSEDKVVAALAEGLLVRQSGLEEKYECTVCTKAMTGKIPAASHLQGAAHLKAMKNRFILKDDKMSSSSSSSGSFVSWSDSSSMRVSAAMTSGAIDEVKLLCKVCSVSFLSKDALITHASCETHFHNQKRWEAKKKPVEAVVKCTSAILSSMPVNAGQLDMMAKVRCGEVQVLMRGEQESYKCVPCQTELSSPLHLRAHLLGRSHITASRSESPDSSTDGPPPAATAVVPTQEWDNGSVSTASVSGDIEQIVIREPETPDTCRVFLALIDNIKQSQAGARSSETS